MLFILLDLNPKFPPQKRCTGIQTETEMTLPKARFDTFKKVWYKFPLTTP